MPRQKNDTLTLRTTPDIKDLLKQAEDKEYRSQASMIEVLGLDYAKRTQVFEFLPIRTVRAADISSQRNREKPSSPLHREGPHR